MIEGLAHRWLRPSRASTQDVRLDLMWLLGLVIVLIASGIGLRDPWPADEPRFALIARDMVAHGEWLIPRVGGDLYPDKPPLYLWMLALGYALTGSMRASFLLPSLLSAIGVTALVYDLARRLWNRETALIAATMLLLTPQFVWQTRQAQIDGTLCFWTTLSLYGLMRHLLLGPQWRWYVIGWMAAGFGVLTKGVGFLPLLILIPWAALNARWQSTRWPANPVCWLSGPLAFAAAIAVWLVPMLWAARLDPSLAAYRDEILFVQTAERYLDAWHHLKPFWYFIVQVIPLLWLPLIALVPWLIPQWRAAWRAHDLRVVLPLTWAAVVVLFFSLSPGKRGVYILPALPAFILACSPYVLELSTRLAVRRVVYAVSVSVAIACAGAMIYLIFDPSMRAEIAQTYALDPIVPAMMVAACVGIVCMLSRTRRAFMSYALMLAVALLVVSFWVNPLMNDVRSGARFVRQLERTADPNRELGLVAFREEHLLNLSRPIVHFGHARWREWKVEAEDAAAWMAVDLDRQLMVDESTKQLCFADARSSALGRANRKSWFIVTGAADPGCARRGAVAAARAYSPSPERSLRLISGNQSHELRRDPGTVRAQGVAKHGE